MGEARGYQSSKGYEVTAEAKPSEDYPTLGAIARQFAVDVQREINIRNGCFLAANDQEKAWKSAGAVAVKQLDTVKAYL